MTCARMPLALFVAALAAGTPLHSQRMLDTTCSPAPAGVPASAWLERTQHAMGMSKAEGRVVRSHSVESVLQDYESDRTYPPFFQAFTVRDQWLDPWSGALRGGSHTIFIGQEFSGPELLNTERATWSARDTALAPAEPFHLSALLSRSLDAWAVAHDWVASRAVSVAGRCPYRDYPRIVLQRVGPFGPERLFLDSKTALPVKLDRIEPHYLWGQVHVEYVYSTWVLDSGVAHPGSAFRITDGEVETSRTIRSFQLMPSDSAPRLAVPATTTPMALVLPRFLQPVPPDTVRVGPRAFLLKNPGFGELVTLARDTVFVLDATQSEDRARADSVWIGKLFPGRHPVVLVVTDLAWPHVAGVRFWVASGAAVVSHRASRAFLEHVVARRWTVAPDKLERQRATARLRFRPVSDSLRLAGGALSLYAIDGIGSEGAVMAYVADGGVLWGSDYVQDVSQPTLYAREVWRAVHRAGLSPVTVSAEHIPATPWEAVRRLVAGMDVEAP